jgi:hypothetical protein
VVILFFSLSAMGDSIEFRHWDVRPSVTICEGSGVDIDIAREALSYWNDFGLEHSRLISGKCSEHKEDHYGKIIVRVTSDKRSFREKNYDSVNANTTLRYWLNEEHIHHAEILLFEDNKNNLDILTHEFGHSFGLDHSKDKKNIMHINNCFYSGKEFVPEESSFYRSTKDVLSSH